MAVISLPHLTRWRNRQRRNWDTVMLVGSVVEIGVRPAIGYPVELSLKPNRSIFVGAYREVGDRKVSIGLSHVRTMANKPWRNSTSCNVGH